MTFAALAVELGQRHPRQLPLVLRQQLVLELSVMFRGRGPGGHTDTPDVPCLWIGGP